MSRGEYDDRLADFPNGRVNMGDFLIDALAPALSNEVECPEMPTA